ncbi:MAG: acyl carrier protein [Gammaproteobacteria bacterium]|nr:acyl carrier protein [Gammaproteobacteria bacterium]
MAKNTISKKESLELIAEAINEPVDDVQPGVELVTLSGWDSMAVLLLMAEFDDRFDIVLDEDKIKSLVLVDDILAVLEQNNVLND